MREVLRRIAIYGGLTAFALAILGFMFAELATIWLAGSPGVRAETGEPVAGTDVHGTISSQIRTRVPLLMAVWGFAFIAVGELVLHWWRRRRKPIAKPSEPDPAEKLLEELLAQVEATKRQETGDRSQEPGDRRQETVAPSQPTETK